MNSNKVSKRTSSLFHGPLFHARLIVAGALALLMIMGCGGPQVQKTEEYSGKLPRPERILVYDFAVSPDEVTLTKGLGPDIMNALNGPPRTARELKVGHAAANALAEELVKRIREFGLPAERAAGYPVNALNSLLIEGQILSVDQGNRTERVVIGLGAGRTEVKANVQVYEETPEGRRNVEDFVAQEKSGHKPGMGEMMGIGALAGHLLTSTILSGSLTAIGETSWATVEADAKRMAKKVADDLGQFFVAQGWIPPSAVR